MFTLLQITLIWLCSWILTLVIGLLFGSKCKEEDPLMFKLMADDVKNNFVFGGLLVLSTIGCAHFDKPIVCWIAFLIFAIICLASIPTFIANVVPGGSVPLAKRLTGILDYITTLILTINILFTFII